MPKAEPETVDDLLADWIAGSRLTELSARSGLRPWTILRLRNGEGSRTHAGTVLALAKALRLPVARVRAAIEASRAAAK